MRRYFIETDRIGFSAWTPEDLDDALSLFSNPKVVKYLCAKGFYTDEEIIARIYNEMDNQNENGIQYWPLYLKETGEFIGCCGLHMAEKKSAREIGFDLKEEFWHNGLASEAARRVIVYAFDYLHIKELHARVHPENTSSLKLVRSLGFEHVDEFFDEPSGLMFMRFKMINGFQM